MENFEKFYLRDDFLVIQEEFNKAHDNNSVKSILFRLMLLLLKTMTAFYERKIVVRERMEITFANLRWFFKHIRSIIEEYNTIYRLKEAACFWRLIIQGTLNIVIILADFDNVKNDIIKEVENDLEFNNPTKALKEICNYENLVHDLENTLNQDICKAKKKDVVESCDKCEQNKLT